MFDRQGFPANKYCSVNLSHRFSERSICILENAQLDKQTFGFRVYPN